MGQYHKPVVIIEKNIRKANKYGCMPAPDCTAKAYNPFDYDNTYKLMEWGYIGNTVLDTALSELIRPVTDKRKRLLGIVGDYSTTDMLEIPEGLNDFRYEIVAAHDAVWNKYGEKALQKKNAPKKLHTDDGNQWYAVNRTLGEYVKLFGLPDVCEGSTLQINPLAVLCCTSNGEGGGDYSGINAGLAGRWAFHDICLTLDAPDGAGYKEIVPGFREVRE